MDAMIVGSGGREHALAWKLSQSEGIENIYSCPGNAGTDEITQNVDIDPLDTQACAKFARENKIDLAIIGPDSSLAAGMVDELENEGIIAFGPTKNAARIESSKSFSKSMMISEGIPTAEHRIFDSPDRASEYLSGVEGDKFPLVIKAGGLALGKGVTICRDIEQALGTIEEIMIDKKHGRAGDQVIIEDFLPGKDMSLHAFCDGKSYKMFPPSFDYKTLLDNNYGPMTGGMGCVAPLPWMNEKTTEDLGKQFVEPALQYMEQYETQFKGVLYPGLRLVPNGGPFGLEYNARFGDPETQAYMRILDSDLAGIAIACANGELESIDIKWKNETAICVVLASSGYPDASTLAKDSPVVIEGIDDANRLEDVEVFHAGTKKVGDNILVNGGRILSVTATGKEITDTWDKVYRAVEKIGFNGKQHQSYIGLDAHRSFIRDCYKHQ